MSGGRGTRQKSTRARAGTCTYTAPCKSLEQRSDVSRVFSKGLRLSRDAEERNIIETVFFYRIFFFSGFHTVLQQFLNVSTNEAVDSFCIVPLFCTIHSCINFFFLFFWIRYTRVCRIFNAFRLCKRFFKKWNIPETFFQGFIFIRLFLTRFAHFCTVFEYGFVCYTILFLRVLIVSVCFENA